MKPRITLIAESDLGTRPATLTDSALQWVSVQEDMNIAVKIYLNAKHPATLVPPPSDRSAGR